MATLQELQAEVRKLRAENERKQQALKNREAAQREYNQIAAERKRLEQEIKSLKNPRSTAFKKVVKKGLRKTGSGLMNFLEAAAESQSPQKRRPTQKKRTPVKKTTSTTKRTTKRSTQRKRPKAWYEEYSF